jgi:cell division protein FtsI/penicillin-binding protein 2
MNIVTEVIFVRLRLIVIGLAILTGLVIFQLLRIDLSSANAGYLQHLEQTITQYPREFQPERGKIYDRNGELLATNDVQYELGISPPNVTNPDEVVETLSDLLNTSSTDIREKLATAKAKSLPYVFIDRPVSADIGNQIKALRDSGKKRLNGVDLTPIPHRVYPGGALAAQLLGFVGYNDQGRQVGYFGVEGFYNDLLAGRPVEGIERTVPFEAQRDPTPDQGADLYLTIDRDIQYTVETAMADAINQYGAESGSIVVMDPRTGEILGMASWPTFDPNNYVKFPPANPEDPAVSGQYEPGSTFKILTMAAALDAGTVKPDTPFMDSGAVEVGGVILTNWDGGAWGPVDMTGCLQHSLNVCLASVAKWMGPKDFYNYLSAFGLGHLTNVDLEAESAGHLKHPGDPDWFDSDLGTNSFGQGVAVTPLQLVTAVSAVANGGAMMQPHILMRVQDGVAVHTTQPQILGRPIRPDTAATLNEMLAQSLERGEGSKALVDGYRIAGKTGTAQIPIPGGYDAEHTIASFVGWGPVDHPQFIVLVKLDRPSASIWGSETAAPLFAQLTKRLVVLLQIPPDAVRHTLTGQ